jgi:hypothetical protein
VRVIVIVIGVVVLGLVGGDGLVDLVHVECTHLLDEIVERLGRERTGLREDQHILAKDH